MHEILSVVFLLILVGLVVVPFAVFLRQRSDYSLWERVLYCPVYCFGRILWRVEVIGDAPRLAEAYPEGAIVVANHRCSLDPFFLQIAAGRRIHWMVAGEYFRNPIFGPILRIFQAIPTNRSGADNAAIKMAIRLASEGRFVGMFPEGQINRTQKPLLKIRSGAAMVATKSGAPLLPCWIDGAPSGWDVWSGLFMAAHTRVFIGKAIDTKSTQRDQNASPEDLIERAMLSSLALGGHTQTNIELARRKNRIQGKNVLAR
ncbi:MAG: lysophospholipid acyltransferase family protein [Pirellulaceae bacterium]|nr:lysophospholipid acyltransferase family protein [Pirellulaceae bacterium]